MKSEAAIRAAFDIVATEVAYQLEVHRRQNREVGVQLKNLGMIASAFGWMLEDEQGTGAIEAIESILDAIKKVHALRDYVAKKQAQRN